MKQYDYVIPIGESCITSFHLRRLNLQVCSYPFDWLMDFRLESLLHYLSNDFSDFLLEKNLVLYQDIPPTSCWHYKDIVTNILFVHCFHKPFALDKTFNLVKEQFMRRIARLRKHLKTGGNVLFVYTSKKDIYTDEYLVSCLNNLSYLYPRGNIDFMYILTIKQGGYLSKKLNNHCTKIVMPYSYENLNPGTGEGDHWQGIHELFDKALKDVRRSQHITMRFFCRVLSYLIPIRTLRIAIRNFWYSYYYA